MTKHVQFAEWSTKEKNDLPDSSFAYIEKGGTKDSDGKTTPRSLRHLPYKDADGKVDLPHTRNALARLDQTEGIPEGEKAAIRTKLEAALNKARASSKYVGVFPFEFDDSTAAGQIPQWIHLIPIGAWDHDAYGPIVISPRDIQQFAQNFNANLRKGVFITAGHENMSELPAQGWITQVQARDTGLWGMVDWTQLGKETLSDKQYKFFSPEFYLEYADPETHEVYQNVLTGGALTKSPYFKELEAVVFSDKNLINKFSDKNMNIADILKKKKGERTAEEKDFLKKHKDEMSEAQKTQYAEDSNDDDESDEDQDGDDDDTKKRKAAKRASKKAASEKAEGDANEAKGLNRDGSKKLVADEKGNVQISAAEYAALKGQADKGASAFAELEKAKLNTAVTALVMSESNKAGRFLPKSEDTIRSFMQTLNDDQRKVFADLIGQLPDAKVFKEVGDTGAGAGAGTVEKELDMKVTAIMASDKTLKYSDALKRAFSENDGLEKRYRDELVASQK
jgi:hypothetical protein